MPIYEENGEIKMRIPRGANGVVAASLGKGKLVSQCSTTMHRKLRQKYHQLKM